MATPKTDETNGDPFALLARRHARVTHREWERAYRRAVREFAKDAECTETEAQKHLAAAGLNEPKAE